MKNILKTAASALSTTLLLAGSALAQDEAANPIADIAGDMSAVVRDLSKLATGKPTQETQKDIVRKLDELIEQLEKD